MTTHTDHFMHATEMEQRHVRTIRQGPAQLVAALAQLPADLQHELVHHS